MICCRLEFGFAAQLKEKKREREGRECVRGNYALREWDTRGICYFWYCNAPVSPKAKEIEAGFRS
jgi:hypothetical protein